MDLRQYLGDEKESFGEDPSSSFPSSLQITSVRNVSRNLDFYSETLVFANDGIVHLKI